MFSFVSFINFRFADLCDAATDSQAFIARSLHAMNEAEAGCEDAIKAQMPVKLVGHTSSLARLANRLVPAAYIEFTTISMCNATQFYYRVLQVAKQETENSEDPGYINRVGEASDNMASTVPHMVDSAKSLAKNITHPGLLADWRKNNRAVSHLKIEIFVTVVRNHLKIKRC